MRRSVWVGVLTERERKREKEREGEKEKRRPFQFVPNYYPTVNYVFDSNLLFN